MDELEGEGIDPQVIQELDMGELSGHWQRSKMFLGILATYAGLGSQARQRQVVEKLIAHWQHYPPNTRLLL